MRKSVFAVGLAALLGTAAVTPAEAQVDGSGYISLRGARNKIKVYGASETVTSYGADAAAVFRPAGRYNIQLNGSLERWDTDFLLVDEDGDPLLDADGDPIVDENGDPIRLQDTQFFGGDAHLFWGRPDAYTIGGFVSIQELDLFDLANETIYGGGFEFDLYNEFWTTSAQAGYFLDEEDLGIYGVSGQARLYATPIFSLEGSAAYGAVDDDDIDADTYGFGAEAEYQFDGTPLSIFAGAKYTKVADYEIEDSSLALGVRWSLGSRTLLERDRTGASMRGSQKIFDLLGP
jgi:hypothetical protein